MIGDYALMFMALTITLTLIRSEKGVWEGYLLRHFQLFGWLFLGWILSFYIEGLYSLRSAPLRSLPVSLMRALSLALIGSISFFYLFPSPGITPKRNLLLIAAITMLSSWLWHRLIRAFASSQRMSHRVALVGDQDSLREVVTETRERPWLGYEVVQQTAHVSDVTAKELDLLVVSRKVMKEPLHGALLLKYLAANVGVVELGKFTESISGKVPIQDLDEAWFLEACGTPSSSGSKLSKLLLDRSVALILLIVLIPLFLVVIPILLIVHGRPLFYSQIRTGHLNQPFRIWKFRTMVVDAEKAGAQWSKPGDARITPLGKILRATRIDELPQLWNILNGEMSLVGPRPERPEIIKENLAPTIAFYEQRHLVKPGVTGWAQVNYRYGFSTDDAIRKLQLDLYYVKHQNFWLDVQILLRTLKIVLTGAGQ